MWAARLRTLAPRVLAASGAGALAGALAVGSLPARCDDPHPIATQVDLHTLPTTTFAPTSQGPVTVMQQAVADEVVADAVDAATRALERFDVGTHGDAVARCVTDVLNSSHGNVWQCIVVMRGSADTRVGCSIASVSNGFVAFDIGATAFICFKTPWYVRVRQRDSVKPSKDANRVVAKGTARPAT